MEFGKLEAVLIRDGWPGEATDFTPWLAKPENLCLLANEIGLDIVFDEIESEVGPFRADILAHHQDTGDLIVIENQYGRTDHNHLGQLLTYAAGVGQDGSGAKTVIWIAERFIDPHRAVLDWLNKCTEPGIRFFGVELQLWRIGASAPAPRFQVVCRPNGWQKRLTQQTQTSGGALSSLYQEFWNEFILFCTDKSPLKLSIAPAQHWLPVFTLSVGIGVNLTVSKRDGAMTTQLWIESKDAKDVFDSLSGSKAALFNLLGSDLKFDRKDGKNPCSIYQSHVCTVTDKAEWPTMHAWLKERGEVYIEVFRPLIKSLSEQTNAQTK